MSPNLPDDDANGSRALRGSRAFASRFRDNSRAEQYFLFEFGCEACAVRDHQKSTTGRGDEFERKFQELISRSFVEIACGLIGKQKARSRCKRPSDCDTLLLPAGKLLGIAARQTLEPEVSLLTHHATRNRNGPRYALEMRDCRQPSDSG